MKLTQVLFATLLSTAAFSTFAATQDQATETQTEKVVVSTQEQPVNTEATATTDSAAPASEVSAETPTPAAQ